MEAVAALQRVLSLQQAFKVLAMLSLTAYLFPKQAVVNENEEFDFVVVGGGSAGTVAAVRLAEANFKVLLIEAGKEPPVSSLVPALFPYLAHSEADWNYTNVRVKGLFQCQRKPNADLTIGHILGGGSSINYFYYVRGCPGDFDCWVTAAKDSSWSYKSLLPYFIKSERLEVPEILNSRYRHFHGTQGFLGVTRENNPQIQPYLEAFKQAGNPILLDIEGNNSSLGYTPQLYTIADGVRQSTAYTLLGPDKSPNLKVLKHTFATNILFDETNKAVGVKAITEDNEEVCLLARNEVILSAGALNTPRILMTSGIGPKDHLKSLKIQVRKDLPVGRNLQDHISAITYFKMDESKEPPPPSNPFEFPSPGFTGYVALNKSHQCPTYQSINMLIPANSNSLMETCVFNFGYKFEICQQLYENSKNRNIMFARIGLLHPKSRGQLKLRSCDPRDTPIVDVGYFENNEDLETLVDSLIDFVRVLNTKYFRSVNAEMVDLKIESCKGLKHMSRDWWRCYVRCTMLTIFHYSGTCALGSVVDSKLRVFGIKGLRVVDNSIMPKVVGANTNAAAIVIGEKGADIIRQEYL